jgi:hypothetical protein
MAAMRKIIRMATGRGRQDSERRSYFSHYAQLSAEIILIHDDKIWNPSKY